MVAIFPLTYSSQEQPGDGLYDKMGNVCSFDSPDLVRYVAVAAAAGLVSVIPTFAVAPDNADILSVQGSFTVSCQSKPRKHGTMC